MNSRWRIFQLFLWITILGSSGSILQAQIRERLVIATGVVCRAQPNVSARQVYSYKLGDTVGATDESKDEKGMPWFFDQWRISGQLPSCWVYGPLTTEFVRSNPAPALLALVDHVLQRQSEARFKDYVAVENLLSETPFDSIVRSSGILQFRKLSIINQAISREDAGGHVLDREPLKKAWVLAHGTLVSYFEPGDEWVMRPEAYWNLFEQYKQEPWAEDLAWAAAQLNIPGDECYAYCLLERIDKTFLQYWSRYPNGYAVSQSLIEAARIAKGAADVACFDKGTDYSVPRPVLEKIRNSLVEVIAPQKSQLLEYIDQVERKCYSAQK
jgi:hypothetical protein